MNIPKVNLHPASIKYLKLGHPWITADSYSNKFPKDAFFLIGADSVLLINDPEHKNVKARLWSTNVKETDFKTSLKERIHAAVSKRVEAPYFKERENVYLINGESDLLPGLLVLKLKNEILIQYYALFWKKVEVDLLEILKSALADFTVDEIWIQERNFNQKKAIRSVNGKKFSEFVLNEYGVNYKILINEHYDFGIYTDMSAIRTLMAPYLLKAKSMLNLYSYTGAFSLFGLKLGLERIVSVDLSPKYLGWLDENIALNSFDKTKHTSMCMPSEKALQQLINEGASFDALICDPPSASSDGESTTNALKSYEKLLPMMIKLMSKDGMMFVFLNTHTISWNKFEEKLKQIIEASEFKNQMIIGKRFKLSDDCTPLKGFHEGDYLKGLLIEFKNKGK